MTKTKNSQLPVKMQKTVPEQSWTDEQKESMRKMLENLERKINEHLMSYFIIGEALKKIKEDKLFRALDYTSFEEYCKAKFDYSRAHGYRLIAYYEILQAVDPEKKDWNISENVVRKLRQLKSDEAAGILKSLEFDKPIDIQDLQTEIAKKVEDKKAAYLAKMNSHCAQEEGEFFCPFLHKKIKKSEAQSSEFMIQSAKGSLTALKKIIKSFKDSGCDMSSKTIEELQRTMTDWVERDAQAQKAAIEEFWK